MRIDDAGEILGNKIRALMKMRGWSRLSQAQMLSIPYIAKGYNTLVIAPTGYGKTEAAILPILDALSTNGYKPVAVLYITPLKALINDLASRIEWWASKLGVSVARKHGDVPQSEKARRLRKVPHIMILTPESLEIDLDWDSRFRRHYKNLQWIIVDEIHELVASKRGAQLSILLERLRRYVGRDFQVIGLSATVENPDRVARMIFGSSRRPSIIISPQIERDIELHVRYVPEDKDAWMQAARTVVEELDPPSLIFVNSRFTAERLHEALEKLGVKDVFVHHSSVARAKREEAEKKLREGKLRAIICTKTLELGIDAGEVKSVIVFRPPGSAISLLQRIGRSGHSLEGNPKGGVIGIGIMDLLENLATVRLALRRELEPPLIPRKPLDVVARELIGMCLQCKRISLSYALNVIRGSCLYRNLGEDDLRRLADYLVKNGILSWTRDGRLKLGSSFYKIWRFDTDRGDNRSKRWWHRSFTEFFSMIGERESFTVRHKGIPIGDLDAMYVYRYLRVNDVLRLSGRAWRIIGIDDLLMRIDVEPAKSSEGEIPLWRGETIRRSASIAEEVSRIIQEVCREGMPSLPRGVSLDSEAEKALIRFVEEHRSKGIPLPSSRRIIVDIMDDEYVFITLIGQNTAETIAHILMYLASRTSGLNVAARASYYGFSLKARGIDPLEELLSIKPEEVEELARKAALRSPLLGAVIRDIQLSLGKIGRPDPEEDKLIYDEAVKQLIDTYFDIEGARKFIEDLRRGGMEVIVRRSGPPSPLSLQLRRLPLIKPWARDATPLIVKSLEGMAFTVDEIAEILDLPPKTIESKLKELRKPGTATRVFQFIDLSFDEWRWGLVKDAHEIFSSEEFSDSFEPMDYDEAFVLMVKPMAGESYYNIIFTPKDIVRSMEEFARKIPVDEAHEVKVMPLADSLLKSLAPKYYHVPREIIPYIALNGAAFLQKLKEYN